MKGRLTIYKCSFLFIFFFVLIFCCPFRAVSQSGNLWNTVYPAGVKIPDLIIDKYSPHCLFGSKQEITHWADSLRNLILTKAGISLTQKGKSFRIQKTIQDADYTILVATLEAQPGFLLPLNIYLPKNAAPKVPLIFHITGCHSSTADAEPQLIAGNMARHGAIVIITEGFCQNGPRDGLAGNATPFGYSRELMGMSGDFGLYLQELISTLNWALEYFPQVDPTKIGTCGYSYGGQMSFFFAQFDKRISSISVPATALATSSSCTKTELNEDIYVNDVYGLEKYSWSSPMSIPLLPIKYQFILIYPRFFHTTSGDPDQGAPTSFISPIMDYAKNIYTLSGDQDKILYLTDPDPHSYNQNRRQDTYKWFDHTLWGNPLTSILETTVAFRSESQLWANISGTKTLSTDLTKLVNDELASRFANGSPKPENTNAVETHFDSLWKNITPKKLSVTTNPLYFFSGLKVTPYLVKDSLYDFPVFLFENTHLSTKKTLVYLPNLGTKEELDSIIALSKIYSKIYSVDYLGMGELRSNRIMQHTFARYLMNNSPSVLDLNINQILSFQKTFDLTESDIMAQGWVSSLLASISAKKNQAFNSSLFLQGLPKQGELKYLLSGVKTPDLLLKGGLFKNITAAEIAAFFPDQVFYNCNKAVPNIITNCYSGKIISTAGSLSTAKFQWMLDNNEIAGAINPFIVPKVAGKYTLKIFLDSSYCVREQASNALYIQSKNLVLPEVYKNAYSWRDELVELPGLAAISPWKNRPPKFLQKVKADQLLMDSSACETNKTTPSAFSFPSDIHVVQGPKAFCEGDSSSLSVEQLSKYRYSLFNDTNFVSNSTSLKVTNTARIFLEIMDSAAHKTYFSADYAFKKNNLPKVTTKASPRDTLCDGDTLQIKVSETGLRSYQWYGNGQLLSSETTSLLSVSSAGTYTVKAKDSLSCYNTSAAMEIKKVALPENAISASPDTAYCKNDSVKIFASANPNYVYNWTYNGLKTARHWDSTLIAKAPGNYSYRVTDLKTRCLNSSKIIHVEEKALPESRIIAFPDSSFCENDSIRLNVQNHSSYSFQWKLNGAINSSFSGTEIITRMPGIYSVLINDASTGCRNISAPVHVIKNLLPEASILAFPDSNFCEKDSVSLKAPAHPGFIYQWSFNGVKGLPSTSPNYTAGIEGSYSFLVEDFSTHCLNTSKTITLHKLALPDASVFAFPDSNFCAGDSIKLVALSGANYIYQWKLNGSIDPAFTQSVLNPVSSGNYAVIVKDSSTHCFNTSSTIHVKKMDIPDARIDVLPDSNFCAGDSITLKAKKNKNYLYQWSLNGKDISQHDFNLITDRPGTYSLVLRDLLTNCASSSRPINARKNPLPEAAVSFFPDSVICNDAPVLLSVTSPKHSTDEYFWYRNNVLYSTGDPSILVRDSGEYYCRVQNVLTGCSAASALKSPYISDFSDVSYYLSEDTIHVKASKNYTYSWKQHDALLPDETKNYLRGEPYSIYTLIAHEGKSCFKEFSPLQLDISPLEKAITVYPTVVDDEINITSTVRCSIELITNTGKKANQQYNIEPSATLILNVSNLRTGSYYLRFSNLFQSHVVRILKK